MKQRKIPTLAALAVLTYLPILGQPFLSDDYIQIHLGRLYGPVSAWPALALDALYRCRATSILLTHWTEQAFGLVPLGFYITAVALHAAATCMLYLTAFRKLRMDATASFFAAAFFAVYEGHQEAVMWYASLPELLLFLACLGFVWRWVDWMESGRPLHYALALGCFVLALLSKEPGVVLVPVAAALLFWKRRLRLWMWILPLALLALVYTWGIFTAKADHLHLNDGTFSSSAPFVVTWLRSLFRMFWFWGFLSLLVIRWKQLPLPAVFWIAVSLLPYCFLTYMPHVPSRHIYLASAGMALIVGVAFTEISQHRWLLKALLAAMLIHNIGYVWIKKRQQFLDRAEPTEQLLRIAREKGAPLTIGCFPYTREVAERTVEVMLRWDARQSLRWSNETGALDLCGKLSPVSSRQ